MEKLFTDLDQLTSIEIIELFKNLDEKSNDGWTE